MVPASPSPPVPAELPPLWCPRPRDEPPARADFLHQPRCYRAGVSSPTVRKFWRSITTGSGEQLRRRRVLIPVTAGLILVGVPTVFAVFPTLTTWPIGVRALILAAWVGVAGLAAYLTNRADERLHETVQDERAAAILAEHRSTLRDQFEGLLQPGVGGIPDQYHLTVYAPSPDGVCMVPVYPAAVGPGDPSIFPVGVGAVGRVWATQDVLAVIVKGPAVSSPEHGLTRIQQARYAMFGVVAATLIRDERGDPIGAISAIARDDDRFFEDEHGLLLLRNLARGLAWIIPEAVDWMMPRGREVRGDTTGS